MDLFETSDSGFLSGESLYLSSRFRDIELLAVSQTGYSRVFRAQRMGKWHVLKCLKSEYIHQAEYRALLQKEFEIGYSLNHPNIAATIALEEVEGLGVCIVMEYIDGRTLRKALQDESWTKERVVKVMQQLGEALDYIHQRQVIHRDVKPENILLTNNGDQVKLIDFGLSDADSYMILKQPAGTMRYAAPEQMQTGRVIDGRADIYAFGVILSEFPCLTRRMKQIARRCTAANEHDRYDNAADILWISRHNILAWGFLLVLLALLATVFWVFVLLRRPPSEIIRYQRTTKIVTEHDTIRESVPVVKEVMVPQETPQGIEDYYEWVKKRANENSELSMQWMEQQARILPTFEEVAKLSIQAQRRARTQTEKEMKVELQKYLAADNPQFHVIYASAQFYLGQAIGDYWVAMAYKPRLSKVYQEAQERIQKAQSNQ